LLAPVQKSAFYLHGEWSGHVFRTFRGLDMRITNLIWDAGERLPMLLEEGAAPDFRETLYVGQFVC
jgi:hypothetical protein